MQLIDGAKILTAVFGLCAAAAGQSHPYEGMPEQTPLVFILHHTEDGRPIYTNIPKKCFSGKRLSCIQLHPVFKGSGTIRQPE